MQLRTQRALAVGVSDEDAFISICDNIDKLQKQLDSWVEEYGDGTTTYYPDYNYTIEGEYR